MVHALERAGRHVMPGGVVVLIQPHQWNRPFIAVKSPRRREPVAALVNTVFQPLVTAAVAAIHTVVEEKRFALIGTSHHQFSVQLASLVELRRYLHLPPRPSRFPAGGRQRLHDLWKRRAKDARIEVTEFLTVIALRVAPPRSSGSRT
jgi:hypothetical protein